MTSIDQFESRFRGAAKDVYRHRERTIDHVVVFTDLSSDQTASYGKQVQRALEMLPASDARSWRFVPGAECATIGDLLAIVETYEPDLVVAYRNLHSGAWRWQHSLSDHIEVLTQSTNVPVLLLPRPDSGGTWEPPAKADADHCVMALTDHLAGDSALVDFAVAFAAPGGRLVLAHVEDQHVFERYIEVIGRIPEIDTDVARETILHQLLREPRDYVESAARELHEAGVDLRVDPVVTVGHRVGAYTGLVETHSVDLLVMHTKDDDQLAMHGLSYPLAIELHSTPLLLI
ncbi:MAG: hypothetical protein GY898_06030 [Proteobacteria bacterium]|nr:hypothetical protein [Pseudomonadota bacterium]